MEPELLHANSQDDLIDNQLNNNNKKHLFS